MQFMAEPTTALGAAHPLPQDHPEDEAGADTAGGCVQEDTGGCVRFGGIGLELWQGSYLSIAM